MDPKGHKYLLYNSQLFNNVMLSINVIVVNTGTTVAATAVLLHWLSLGRVPNVMSELGARECLCYNLMLLI